MAINLIRRIREFYVGSTDAQRRAFELGKELEDMQRLAQIRDHNNKVDAAMFIPNGDTNTLLQHFDGMPQGDQFWALFDLLERREIVLMGFRLSRKNLRRIRHALQQHNIDVRPFARDPS